MSIKAWFFCALFTFVGFTIHGQSFQKNFIDTTDHAFDVSNFLNSRTGFLPVPIIITEPAIGYGAGLSLLYFHSKKDDPKYRSGNLPPIISMVAGIYTANGTYAAIIGHQGSYLKDRIRYTGAFGYMNVNLTYFRTNIIGNEVENKFNLQGWVIFQELSFRVKKTIPLFIGANYMYFNNNVSFETGIDIPNLSVLTRETSSAGLNGLIMWDNRDNSFTPNKGVMAAFEAGVSSPELGGQRDFNNIALRTYLYTNKISKKIVAGFRLFGQAKIGNPAFFEKPFISLRGIPAMRYQDNVVGLGETEWRWNVWKRWSLIGFAGVGFTSPDFEEFNLKDGKAAYGGGFRYFLAKQYGIHAGIDIAKGPEQWAWYITVGSNWFR